MSTSFSVLQIQNPNQMEPQQFIIALYIHMRAKGFVPTTENNAQISYSFVFSKNNNWVALTEPVYTPCVEDAETAAREFAEVFKTNCILASVLHNDMVFIDGFGPEGEKEDRLVLGNLDWDIDELSDEWIEENPEMAKVMGIGCKAEEANPDFWKPLLAPNHTWEQLLQAWKGDYVFKQDILWEMSPLLGMDAGYLGTEATDAVPNEITLHFEEAGKKSCKPQSQKPKTLNATFKQVFGEALEPLGFVKIKGKQPYFVRLIGNEILHIVTYIPRPDKYFDIIGGVATVYRQRLSLDASPSTNVNWLHSNLHFYEKLNPFDENPRETARELREFSYREETRYLYDNDGCMIRLPNTSESVENALEITMDIMLPILDEVTDLNACIEYFHKFETSMIISYSEDFTYKWGGDIYNEGLLHIKTDSLSDVVNYGEKRVQEFLDMYAYRVEKGIYPQKGYEACLKEYEEGKPQRLTVYEKLLNDRELIARAHVELERRKAANTEILRSYGFNL